MSVNATCAKCNSQLVNDTLKLDDGSKVQISKCPKNHGKIITKDNRVYFVTFHPAATIYNQKLEEVFKNDIKKLVNELQKIKNQN